jgi:Domain of unknown function (DUF4138)
MKRIVFVGLILLVTLVSHAQEVVVGVPAGTIAHVLEAPPYHERQTTTGGVRLELTGIYIDSNLLWVVFRGINRSAIDFRPGSMRFAIRDKKALKRRALQELPLSCVVRSEPPLLQADSTIRLAYGLVPRVPGKNQELRIAWVERNGDRRLLLRVPANIILTARRLSAAGHKN